MNLLFVLLTIIIGIVVLFYVAAKRFPVSGLMRRVTWLLILPAVILPPVLLMTGMQRGKSIDLFLNISALSALSIGAGAALAFRIAAVQKEYRWIGIAGAVVAPVYAFFTFALAIAASFAD